MTTQDKTTAIYVRTAVRSRTGDQSLATQEQACRTYAAAQGRRVGEVFADVGTWGTQRYRPSMHRLLGAVRDGVVERVLIARPDRLSRSYTDSKAILRVFEEWDVQCVSVKQAPYWRFPIDAPALISPELAQAAREALTRNRITVKRNAKPAKSE